MTSARVFDTVRSWVNKMTLIQELTASAGAVAFLMGLLTSDPLWRTVALVLAGSSIAYVIVTLRSKSLPDLESEAPSIINEEMESEIEETRRPGEPEREKAPDSPA
ncbi:MAG: hypothetical protein HY563_05300, partial [Ignavibacteriales bacterium]|nr:hypothetical protein [Ignavibacteriales bacterium]